MKGFLMFPALAPERLPVRERVEIVIYKGDEILLILSANQVLYSDWRGFPGGGVDGNTPREACRLECLEEVGIKIKNLRCLDISLEENHVSGKGNRKAEYRGTRTTWYAAEYDGEDHSLLNADNDAKQYEWANRKIAKLKLMASGGPRVSCQLRAITLAY
jgi:8-oxo-dGTP pyrophosphatase MutT (NUDIX family)